MRYRNKVPIGVTFAVGCAIASIVAGCLSGYGHPWRQLPGTSLFDFIVGGVGVYGAISLLVDVAFFGAAGRSALQSSNLWYHGVTFLIAGICGSAVYWNGKLTSNEFAEVVAMAMFTLVIPFLTGLSLRRSMESKCPIQK